MYLFCFLFFQCTAIETGKPVCFLHDLGLDTFTSSDSTSNNTPKSCYKNYEKEKSACLSRYALIYQTFVTECKKKPSSEINTSISPSSSCEQQYFISILGATCCPYGGCDF